MLWEMGFFNGMFSLWGAEEPDYDGDLMDYWFEVNKKIKSPYIKDFGRGNDYGHS